MRRNEQLYKALNKEYMPEMYRHYQGGDEFFFLIRGDLFDAIGFINRLAERTKDYSLQCKDLLKKWVAEPDLEQFQLSFASAIRPFAVGKEPDDVLIDTYMVLNTAKESRQSRLLIVVDGIYETPTTIRERLESFGAALRSSHAGDAGGEESVSGERLTERQLNINIEMLKKSELLFPPKHGPMETPA
jgi:hypothetical protein